MPISLGMYLDRGWALNGTFAALNANALPLSITSSLEKTFTVDYRGSTYTFPMADLVLFLDRSYTYLPYPSYLRLEGIPEFLNVGESRTVKPVIFYSNGTSEYIKLDDLDFEIVSTNENVIAIQDRTISAKNPGESSIQVNYLGNLDLHLPIIVKAADEKLFAQSHYKGQFPNGIN